jgi:drug/metabolite transporter (DMT)-like permease
MAAEINASTWAGPNPAGPPSGEPTPAERRPLAGTLAALGAALFFGGAGPFAKKLLPPGGGELGVAAALYLAAGLGLAATVLVRDLFVPPPARAPLAPAERRALLLTTVLGGFFAPILLLLGLARASGAAILAGSVVIAAAAGSGTATAWGVAALFGCSAAWAADTTLTARLAGRDPLLVAAWKCLLASPLTVSAALLIEGPASLVALARTGDLLPLAATGFFGYGLSISLFVIAIRWIGVARTGALFGTSPLLGAAVAIVYLGEQPTLPMILAAVCMAIGAAAIMRKALA